MKKLSVVEGLAKAFAEAGVERMFGLPGGGSSLDLIEAGAARGIDFVLTRTESAAVMMAGATAEATGVPGVALVSKGPGVANAANGVAYAALDRAPVVVVTDGFTPAQRTYITHQVYDQQALLAPLVKGHSRLEGTSAGDDIRRLLQLACTAPYGPVHVELTGEVARRELSEGLPPEVARAPVAERRIGAGAAAAARAGAAVSAGAGGIDEHALADARRLLSQSRRPVVVIGLEAREHAGAVRELVAKLACPVLPTYKAKGVVPDSSPQVTGVFTGGAQEAECVNAADLIVLIGMDPVELILQPWSYRPPVLEIATAPYPVHYVAPRAGVYGPITEIVTALSTDAGRSEWSDTEIAGLRERVLASLRYGPGSSGLAPDRTVQLTAQAFERHGVQPRMTVDAGAHMFSATAFFPCSAPGDLLISNGLATMGYALPAAIAASLADASRPVVCFTGDGGLMMCMGELVTAVQTRARIVVVVFNDGSLSLIDIKQQSRGLPSRGMRWSSPDFAKAMQAAGGLGLSAGTERELVAALDRAMTAEGPCLIDVRIDPAGYGRQLKAMRG